MTDQNESLSREDSPMFMPQDTESVEPADTLDLEHGEILALENGGASDLEEGEILDLEEQEIQDQEDGEMLDTEEGEIEGNRTDAASSSIAFTNATPSRQSSIPHMNSPFDRIPKYVRRGEHCVCGNSSECTHRHAQLPLPKDCILGPYAGAPLSKRRGNRRQIERK